MKTVQNYVEIHGLELLRNGRKVLRKFIPSILQEHVCKAAAKRSRIQPSVKEQSKIIKLVGED